MRSETNHLRVSAQLIDTADGWHIWSGRYDREFTDIFLIQDKIATAIAAALHVTTVPEGAAPRIVPSSLPMKRI
jgi:TolB-like protein